MKTRYVVTLASFSLAVLFAPGVARAMCGCMVGIRPERPTSQEHIAEKILNKASKVALVREGEVTIMTMSSDVHTEIDGFGLVVPVPTVITKKDVRVVEPAVFTALEQITNPRLIEMYDADPCPSPDDMIALAESEAKSGAREDEAPAARKSAADYGVRVEAHYDVGEYSIAVLSAREGRGAGLIEWLNKFHYDVPQDALPVLNSYIKQNMRFFVAKVNFKKISGHERATFLRPIQVRYETPRFMLPVRLGMINADGPQELVAYAFSPKGRIEATNYRTIRLPTGQDLPLYVKDQFEKVYAGIFDAETRKHDMGVIFVEYVQRGTIDMSTEEKVGLGWGRKAMPGQFSHFTMTRLHFRYDRDHFPEDLVLQETADNEPFRVSYNVHHQAKNVACEEAKPYLAALPERRAKEAEALAMLTTWDIREIREKMALTVEHGTPVPTQAPVRKKSFWDSLFE